MQQDGPEARRETPSLAWPAGLTLPASEGVASPASAAAASAGAAGAFSPVDRRPSLTQLLMREGSLAALGVGSLTGGMGSQELGGYLDPTSLQRVQTLSRMDLDLLFSPKWKALLSWDEGGAAAEGPDLAGAAGSPLHLDTAGSNATSNTLAPSLGGGSAGSEGRAPASPGVDQDMSSAEAVEAWQQAQRAAQQAQRGFQAGGDADMEPAGQELPASFPLASLAWRQLSGMGKKRPSWAFQQDALPDTPTGRAPAAKQLRQEEPAVSSPAAGRPPLPRLPPGAAGGQQAGQPSLLGMSSRESGAMLLDGAHDADAAASMEAGYATAATADTQQGLASVLSGLGRVRLSSIGSVQEQRWLAAAAASAASAEAAQRGSGFQMWRGDSGIPLIDAHLVNSPAYRAALLLPGEQPGSDATPAAATAAAATHATLAGGKGGKAGGVVLVEVKAEGGLQSMQGMGPEGSMALPLLAPASLARTALATRAAAAAEAPGVAAAAEEPTARLRRQVLPTKSHKAVATGESGVFTSGYRGVTKHRLTGRYEAHFWDSSYIRPNAKKGKRAKGRQVYVGGYETEVEAARAYDRAVVAYLGTGAPLNFAAEDYAEDLEWMQGRTPDEVVAILRRGSVGFARGQSKYRGVTQHHQQGKWEARIGRVEGAKYLYLGTFESPEEAARAYDRACVKYRGAKAILNFSLSDYRHILEDPDAYDPLPASMAGTSPAPPASSAAHTAAGGMAQHYATPGAAAAAAGVAELGGVHGMPAGSVFLPMTGHPQAHPQAQLLYRYGMHHLPMAVSPQAYQQQDQQGCFQLSPMQHTPGSTFAHFSPTSAAAAEAGAPPRLPAIRTRVAAQVAAAAAAAAAASRGAPMGCTTPRSVGSAGSDGLVDADLADLLLSPLAASLLSPLGLAGSPAGWRDSPLGRVLAGSSAAGGSGGLPSPTGGRHRLANVSGRGGAAAEGGAHGDCALGPAHSGHSSGQLSGQLSGLARLFSTPTSKADLASAMQWLESLDPAQLAFMLDSPAAAAAAATPGGSVARAALSTHGGGSGGQDGGGAGDNQGNATPGGF